MELKCLEGVCDIVRDTSALKALQKHARRALYTTFTTLYVRFTHTKARERGKCAGSDVDTDSDYWDINIIWFNNLFRESPMETIPGSVSNNDRADPTNVKSRTKNRTLPQVLIMEKIDLLVLLSLIRLLISTITKKVLPQGVLQIFLLPEIKSMRREPLLPQAKEFLRWWQPRH